MTDKKLATSCLVLSIFGWIVAVCAPLISIYTSRYGGHGDSFTQMAHSFLIAIGASVIHLASFILGLLHLGGRSRFKAISSIGLILSVLYFVLLGLLWA